MNTVLVIVTVLLVAMIVWFVRSKLRRGARPEADWRRQQRTRAQDALAGNAAGGNLSGATCAAVYENGEYRSLNEANLYEKLQPYRDLVAEHRSLIDRVEKAYEDETPTEALMREAERLAPEIQREEEALTEMYIETEFADDVEAKRFEAAVFELSGALDDFVYNVEWLRGHMDDQEKK